MEELMEKTFEGSLPAFLAAFCSCGNLSEEESRQLAALIEDFKG
jgi:predicted transcriptional regulator